MFATDGLVIRLFHRQYYTGTVHHIIFHVILHNILVYVAFTGCVHKRKNYYYYFSNNIMLLYKLFLFNLSQVYLYSITIPVK